MMQLFRALLTLLALLLFSLGLPTSARADPQYKLLVLAIPNKYHYEYIPIARESLERLSRLHDFDLTFTNDPKVFEGDLQRYAAVLFLNTPGDELNPAQRLNFETYMRGGGNAVIVHRAVIMKPDDWPWYEKLVGRSFVIHPMFQTGVVTPADPGFPATFGLPSRWIWSDEFYVTANPHGVKIEPVLNVDETSYDPTRIWPGQVARPMGKDHPIAWWHRYEKGRVFVTTLGHDGNAYRDPAYLSHLLGGIYWAATGLGRQP
jgi:hypothetical protein